MPSAMMRLPTVGHRAMAPPPRRRDLEAQLAIVTENRRLRQRLDEERKQLYERTSQVDKTTFQRPDHFVPDWVALVTDWIKNYF